jgi:hypothetical protein
MNNGINFAMEGPMMEGTWYNTITGDSFTVRDTFFENNQLMVATTDGRMLDYNIIQNYIKSDKPITPQKKTQSITNELPAEVLSVLETNDSQDDILEEDMNLLQGNMYNQPVITQNPSINQVVTQQPVETEDDMLVRRILKRSIAPEVDCKVTWKNFPTKQMEMLDMMAVDVDAIVDYYIKDIDLNTIKEIVKDGIKKHIEKSLSPQDEEVKEKPQKPTKKETTKTSKK